MPAPALRVLALVTDAFGGQGGIAQYNQNLLTSLSEADPIHEVIVLPRGAVGAYGELPGRLLQLRPVHNKIAFSFAAFHAAHTFRPIDVVLCGHLFMAPLAASIAKLAGARLWIQVHGLEVWQELSALHRRSIEHATLVTSVSRYTRRRLLEWAGVEPYKVKVLPNTVDERFHPGPKAAHLVQRHNLSDARVLITVSRLTRWDRYKGHDKVLRILPRVLQTHPDVVYLIVGDGEDRPRLEALARELGIQHRVRFIGAVTNEELPDFFRLADVFVMPSTGEGFGIVFLEAMACGLRVVGGNQDGSIDPLVGSALASIVDPENCDALASAVQAALDTPISHLDGNGRFSADLFGRHLNALVSTTLVPTESFGV